MNETKDKKQVLRRLFFSTLYLSAFTFGGGYVIVTLLKKKFVDECHWIEEDEMLDLVAIAQSAPGAIAVNGAIVVGYKLAGMLGAAVAIVATILPPFVIISVISVFYEAFRDNFLVSQMLTGMQAGVGAVIASVVWQMCRHLLFRGERGAGDPGCGRGGRGAHPAGPAAEKGGGPMIYLQLFWSFLQIGLFSFGGGYAAIPLIQGQIVDQHGWLSMPEFTDLVTISQMTPGPIAINSATFVGIKIAGLAGALVATLGCILPSCIIVTLIARLYLKYRSMALLQGVLGSLRPAVIALIASAGISILITAFWGDAVIAFAATNWVMVLIFALCVFLLLKCKLDPILVMVLAGVLKLAAAAAGLP